MLFFLILPYFSLYISCYFVPLATSSWARRPTFPYLYFISVLTLNIRACFPHDLSILPHSVIQKYFSLTLILIFLKNFRNQKWVYNVYAIFFTKNFGWRHLLTNFLTKVWRHLSEFVITKTAKVNAHAIYRQLLVLWLSTQFFDSIFRNFSERVKF